MEKQSNSLNLNMLWMALRDLQKPKEHGEIIEINVGNYLDLLAFKDSEIAGKDGTESLRFTTVKLVAVVYTQKDKDDDMQWELAL